MALQDTGQIKLTDIQQEFEGEYFDSNDSPIQRSHYSFSRYQGKNGISPTGPVRASDFYGKFTVKNLSFETGAIAIKDYDPSSPYLINVETGQDQVVVNRSHDAGSYDFTAQWTDDNTALWNDDNGDALNSNQTLTFADSAEITRKKQSINIFHKASLGPNTPSTATGQLQLQVEPTGTWKPGEWVLGNNNVLSVSISDNDYPVNTNSLHATNRYTFHFFPSGHIGALYNSYTNLDRTGFSTVCFRTYDVSSIQGGLAQATLNSEGTMDRTHRYYNSTFGSEINYFPAWDRNASVVSIDGSTIYMVSAKPDGYGSGVVDWMTPSYIKFTVGSSGSVNVQVVQISSITLNWNGGDIGASYASNNWIGSGENAPSVYGFSKRSGTSSLYYLWGVNALGRTVIKGFNSEADGVTYINNNINNNSIPSNGIELGFDRFYHS